MSTDPSTILVPIDFNEQSIHALERSQVTAPFLGLDIVLLYVYEENGFTSSLISSSTIDIMIQEKLDQAAEEIIQKSRIDVTTCIRKGKVYTEILKAAEEFKSKFILMGTNNSSENIRMSKNTIGSNTLKVVRQSSIPVITINGKEVTRFVHNILLPLDLTKETRQKVTNAIDVAKAFGAGINVVSVLWSKNNKDLKEELLQQLNQVKWFIEEQNIRCESELLESSGGEKMLVPKLLEFVDLKGNIDLIMIMTQQENKLVEYFLGSAAQSIIRMSKVAVMTVTPDRIGYEQPIF
ncbi:MAG: universal stress protein [Bacteroidetes bacterium]|nr:universal stress protein [Bacteroidota bacterium]